MENSASLKVKTPRPYLSYSQLRLFERSANLYKEVYIDGVRMKANAAMDLGKKLADRMEFDEESDDRMIEHLSIYLPRYEHHEYEIAGEISGVPVFGKLDGFTEFDLDIGEYKTGKLWTQSMVDKDDQLTFYAMLVWIRFKRLPEKIRLHWCPTEIVDGQVRPTGEIKTFSTTRRMADIIKMAGRVIKTWKAIINLCQQFNPTQ